MFAGLKASADFARTQSYERFKEARTVDILQTGYPVTVYPETFKSLKLADTWRIEQQRVGLTCSASTGLVRPESVLFIQDFLRTHFESAGAIPIPSNALTVSIAMDNFRPGRSCHEFQPTLLAEPTTARLTYQMLSKRVQATYYTENGKTFLAGVCYYPQLVASGAADYSKWDGLAMERACLLTPSYPSGASRRVVKKASNDAVVFAKECRQTGRRVLIYAEPGKRARHYELSFANAEFRRVDCYHCYRDLRTPTSQDGFEMVYKEEEPDSDEKDYDFGDI